MPPTALASGKPNALAALDLGCAAPSILRFSANASGPSAPTAVIPVANPASVAVDGCGNISTGSSSGSTWSTSLIESIAQFVPQSASRYSGGAPATIPWGLPYPAVIFEMGTDPSNNVWAIVELWPGELLGQSPSSAARAHRGPRPRWAGPVQYPFGPTALAEFQAGSLSPAPIGFFYAVGSLPTIQQASGIAVDKNGNLFIADSGATPPTIYVSNTRSQATSLRPRSCRQIRCQRALRSTTMATSTSAIWETITLLCFPCSPMVVSPKRQL